MFDLNKKNRLPDLHGRNATKRLLVSGKYLITVQSSNTGWRTLIAIVILLAGSSSQLRASPENTQHEGGEPSIDLNFRAIVPITIPQKLEQPNITKPFRGSQEYNTDSEVVDDGAAMGLGNDFSSNLKLSWKSGDTSRLLESEIGLGRARVMPPEDIQPSANIMVNIHVEPMKSAGNLQEGAKPLIEEVTRSPYATITLAILALLGMVSVARRDDIG